MGTPWRFAALFATTSLTIAAVYLSACRPDWAVYAALRMSAEIAMVLTLVVWAAWLWIRPLYRPPVGRVWPLAVAAVAVVWPLLQAMAPRAHLAHSASHPAADFWLSAGTCVAVGAVLAVPTGIALIALGRGRGALPLAATVALLAGWVASFVHCPVTDNYHLLAGHAAVVSLGVLSAFFVWRR